MKRITAILLILSLFMLCGCDINIGNKENQGSSSNTNINGNLMGGTLIQISKYTASKQEIFNHDGVSVTVIEGEYSALPSFQVKNTTEQDIVLVLDAVVYNDVFQASSSGAGKVYKIPAGTDEMLDKCTLLHGSTMVSISGNLSTSVNGTTGSFVQIGTANTVQKREVRFAVYRSLGDSDKDELPKEENLLYRSDLVLLKTSDYDGKEVTKNLPTSECLYDQDGIRIWWQNTTYTASINGTSGTTSGTITGSYKDTFTATDGTISSDGSFSTSIGSATFEGTVTYYTYSSLGNGFCVDNTTGKDIRVEFTATYLEKTSEKEDGDKQETETTKELFSFVPAGKASSRLEYVNELGTPSMNATKVNIRIYDAATGELMAEQSNLEIKTNKLVVEEIKKEG